MAPLLLVANDWWLEPSEWAPPFVTGKLSDFAGLLFFPLLLTVVGDCMALALHRIGLPIDFTLRRHKAATAIALTCAAFTLVKLSPECNQLALDILETLGLQARIVLDPTDLVAPPVLGLSWHLGTAEISRVPLGQIEPIEARHRGKKQGVGTHLDDTIRAGAEAATGRELTEALDEYLQCKDSASSERVRCALPRFRDPFRLWQEL
ncbi:MAG: hypothetical protein GY811_20880 [Myxococcales bacterium]|nr:hypothetical protein [Myxococcales bacterium]